MSTVLKGDKVYFASQQFPDWALGSLSELVKKLGGQTTVHRNEATIVLCNPRSTYHTKELQHIEFLKSEYPNATQPILLPYHYLSICALESQRIPVSSLKAPIPYFVHPDASLDHHPLRAWVSMNVQRQGNETPEEAQKLVEKLLISGGALIVKKRAQADVLVINTLTEFYKVVRDEKKRYGRDWQKLAERDWVEICVEKRLLVWRTGEDVGGEEDELDSMAEDDFIGKPKGPGRPTGKPRMDYTPQDDDFLCRYLAAYYPTGSWGSRKTYAALANAHTLYPVAGRHSDQSWHQRFKSNSAIFSKRVERFVQAHVDETLKTAEEREKAKVAKAAKAGTRGSPEASVKAESSTHPRQATAAGKSPSKSVKRKLVDSDSEDGALAHVNNLKRPKAGEEQVKGPSEDSGNNQPIAPFQVAHETPRQKSVNGPDGTAAVRSAASLLPASDQIDGVDKPSPAVKAKELDPDDAVVDRAMFGKTAQGKGNQSTDAPIESQSSSAGAETQAILADFEKARATAGSPPVSEAKANGDSSQSPRKTVRMDVGERSKSVPPEDGRYHKRARSSEPSLPGSPRQIAQISPLIPHRDVRDIIRPASELVRTRHSLPARTPNRLSPPQDSTTTRMSIPFRLELAIRGVTGNGNEISGVQVTPNSNGSSGHGRFETPSPNRANQSLLRQEVLSSASKRQRAIERSSMKGSSSKLSTPDTIAAKAIVPPRPPLPPIPIQSSSDESSPKSRNNREIHLSPAQRSEKILAGQQLVLEMRQQYRLKIQGLSDKYGMQPTDLFRVVNELPKRSLGGGKGGSEVYWQDVEEGLKRLYGY